MVSLSKVGNTSNVNVSVKPNVNVSVAAPAAPAAPEGNVYDNLPNIPMNESKNVYGAVAYPPSNQFTEEEFNRLKNENEVLKLIIEMERNNPLMYNGYIVADDVKLMKFVQLLTFADDVQLDAEDIGEGCITRKTYRKVHAIYVIKDNETKNLKYDYARVMKELTDLGISTKFVW